MLQISFVDGAQKVDAKLRKDIRSHVMLGKNKGRRIHRRKKQVSSEKQLESDHQTSDSSSSSSIELIIPLRIGSDYSFITFADEIEPYMLESVQRFSTLSKSYLYPLSSIITFSSPSPNWISSLTYDPICFHSQIFASHTTLQRTSLVDEQTSKHYIKTLQLLQTEIKNERLSDVLIRVINILVMHAQSIGDCQAARDHLVGIRRILEVRKGGLEGKSKTRGQIYRSDVGLSLQSGREMVFYEMWRDGNGGGLDSLARIWRRMEDFCGVVNAAVCESRQRVTETEVLESMAEIMYPLLKLRTSSGSVEAVSRDGLLVFCTRVFLHGPPTYPHLLESFEKSLEQLDDWTKIPLPFAIWLSILAKISGLNTQGLQISTQRLPFQCWEAVRGELLTVMWIPLIFDKLGRDAYQSMMKEHLAS